MFLKIYKTFPVAASVLNWLTRESSKSDLFPPGTTATRLRILPWHKAPPWLQSISTLVPKYQTRNDRRMRDRIHENLQTLYQVLECSYIKVSSLLLHLLFFYGCLCSLTLGPRPLSLAVGPRPPSRRPSTPKILHN